MKKGKRFISPILCVALLLLSFRPIACGGAASAFCLFLSILCHVVGGVVGVVTGVLATRSILSKSMKKSEVKQLAKVGEGVLDGVAKLFFGKKKDEAAALADWFSSGDPGANGAAALALLTASIMFHGFGTLLSFVAGAALAEPQKIINHVKQENEDETGSLLNEVSKKWQR